MAVVFGGGAGKIGDTIGDKALDVAIAIAGTIGVSAGNTVIQFGDELNAIAQRLVGGHVDRLEREME